MAASPVLADSSYYIQMMREGRDPLKALALAAATRDLVTCGVVRCEVGRGIRDPNVLHRFQRVWEVMIYVPIDDSLWEAVEMTVWKLDRTGVILPLTDIVIGCCARRTGAVVLTFDKHFYDIPGVRAVSQLDI
ncbi:MAG: PIN domain-containing protein [Verrucomicrobia subdivision 3 bacterium]|nr:PIN domain-containing protein [Limisphaerales bacterium]